MTDADTLSIELPGLGLAAEIRRSDERAMPLAPRQVRRGEAPPTIASFLQLGGPDVALMKPRSDDSRELADRRDGSDFWSILMTLTFIIEKDEAFKRAWLRVDLRPDGGATPPIAFAMDPDRREEGVGVTTSGGLEAGAAALKLTGSRTTTMTLYKSEILALNRLRSDPAWELKPSDGRRLEGKTDFVLTVKTPRETGGRGKVSFGAEVETPRPGMLSRRVVPVSWEGTGVDFRLG